ncbi:neuropathy target esterase sws-like [Agrilus planipennis]|uniref:Neuropathy target esterase sws-like n=1 Tax=Agrilus planipennis TaxID=224129 RepID=A0A7F5RC58_AGRPL|nr:neuropathy target esterase sws-like [Agrilus planipennis]
MDVVKLLINIDNKFGNLLGSTWIGSIFHKFLESYGSFYIILIFICLIALFVGILILRKSHAKAVTTHIPASQSVRFRKRDKALFYGRKMLRKVKSISGQVRNSGQGKKRKMVMRFARRLLQLKKENESEQLKVK